MPAYLRGQERDQTVFVKVTQSSLYYGFSTKDFAGLAGLGITNADMQALGHLQPSQLNDADIRVVGANAPKPPRMKKIVNKDPGVNQQGSVSTFCGIDNIRQAETAGWKFVNGGRTVNLTNNARTVTVGVELENNILYLFPMNRADAEKYASALGLELPQTISNLERERAIVAASRPRPDRVKKAQGDDKGFSTFCAANSLNDALANGFSLVKPAIRYS